MYCIVLYCVQFSIICLHYFAIEWVRQSVNKCVGRVLNKGSLYSHILLQMFCTTAYINKYISLRMYACMYLTESYPSVPFVMSPKVHEWISKWTIKMPAILLIKICAYIGTRMYSFYIEKKKLYVLYIVIKHSYILF